jgi:peroxiredoxin
MTIQVGETLPNVIVHRMGEGGPVSVSTDELFTDQKVVLFAVPGAYTPTCSQSHLPGFVVNADTIKAKGVDRIICLSVNDAFVMSAWGKEQNADALTMIADGNADFVEALGLDMDATSRGMGVRSRRFALIANNGVVEWVAVEEPGKFEVSSSEKVLEALI